MILMKKRASIFAMALLALGSFAAAPAHASYSIIPMTTVTVPVLGVSGGSVSVSSAADATSGNLGQGVYSSWAVGTVQTSSSFAQGSDAVNGISHTLASANVSNPAVAGAASSGGSAIDAVITNVSEKVPSFSVCTLTDVLVPTAGKVDVSSAANAAAGDIAPVGSTAPAGVYSSQGVADVTTGSSFAQVTNVGSGAVSGISTTTATSSVSNVTAAGAASAGDSAITGVIKDVSVSWWPF